MTLTKSSWLQLTFNTKIKLFELTKNSSQTPLQKSGESDPKNYQKSKRNQSIATSYTKLSEYLVLAR